jgi:hypothetical protein
MLDAILILIRLVAFPFVLLISIPITILFALFFAIVTILGVVATPFVLVRTAFTGDKDALKEHVRTYFSLDEWSKVLTRPVKHPITWIAQGGPILDD